MIKNILFIIAICAFVIGCAEAPRKPHKLHYKRGDIVYLKPDSAKVLIVDVDDHSCFCGADYEYKTRPNSTTNPNWNVNESDIYGLVEEPLEQ